MKFSAIDTLQRYNNGNGFAGGGGGGAPVITEWLLNGNTNSAEKYIGTNNKFDLPFAVAGSERMRINLAGALGIGTTTPDKSAVLDLTAANRGALMPRMDTTIRDLIGTPATSLLIYNTNTSLFNYYDGAVWQSLDSSVSANKWLLNGNVLGNDTTWIGSSDNHDVLFKTNNTERARITKAGVILLGATASSTDFPNARTISSVGDTGETESHNIGVVGESVADAAVTTQWGVGVYGVALTNVATSATGVTGEGKVTNTADTAPSIGVRGYATTTHAGGRNIGLYANASGSGVNNLALLMAAGNIQSDIAQTWTLAASTTALNIGSGLLNLDSTNSRVGIGTSAPAAKFHVKDSSLLVGVNQTIESEHFAANLNLNSFSSSYGTTGGSSIVFNSNGTDYGKLLTNSANSQFNISSQNGYNLILQNGTTTNININASYGVIFGNGAQNNFISTNAGDIGIGANFLAPTAKLQVVGSSITSATYSLKVENGANSPLLNVRDDGRTYLNDFTYDGNNGNGLGIKGFLTVEGVGAAYLTLRAQAAGGGASFVAYNDSRIEYSSQRELHYLNAGWVYDVYPTSFNINVNTTIGGYSGSAKLHIKGANDTIGNYLLKVSSLSYDVLTIDSNQTITASNGYSLLNGASSERVVYRTGYYSYSFGDASFAAGAGSLNLAVGGGSFNGTAGALSGNNNIAIGRGLMNYLINGSNNIGIGNGTFSGMYGNCNNNIGIGSNVVFNLSGVDNSIAIGANAKVMGSNSFVIGSISSPINSIFFGRGQLALVGNDGLGGVILQTTSALGGGVSDLSAASSEFIIAGAQGVGTGVGGDIIFKVATSGGTGNTNNNLVEAVRIQQDKKLLVDGLTVGKGGGFVATNTAFGVSALSVNTTGAFSTALGKNALINSNANHNTALGHISLFNVTTGSSNIGVGSQSAINLVDGNDNTAIGWETLNSLVSGNYNVGVGRRALTTTTGSNNTAIGNLCLYSAVGSGNVGIGYGAGTWETGSNKFYVDNVIRGTTENESRTLSLIYGVFDAAIANQRINLNAHVGIGGGVANGTSVLNIANLPTSAAGLVTGDIWSNSGVLTIV